MEINTGILDLQEYNYMRDCLRELESVKEKLAQVEKAHTVLVERRFASEKTFKTNDEAIKDTVEALKKRVDELEAENKKLRKMTPKEFKKFKKTNL